MDLIKLRYFLTVLEHRHFARAAEELDVSQQAVSAAVARLERELAVRLFDRSTQGVAPTEYAHVLERHARLVLSETRMAEAEIAAIRGGGRGQVRVGLGLSFGSRVIPAVLTKFRQRFAGHEAMFVVDATIGLYQRLERGDLDIVVSAPPTGLQVPRNVERESLGPERDAVLVRAAHPLARRARCTLADLSRCTWIASAVPMGGGWERICATFVAHQLEPPRDVVRTDSVTLSDTLLLAGDYVGVLSWEAHLPDIEAGRIVELDAPELSERRVAYLAYRKATLPSAGAIGFMRALREVMQTPRVRVRGKPLRR
jgi:DNA-binding transcriptional LysR family regulator